jgi:hypothetical protein
MSLVKTTDGADPWAPLAALVMILALATISFVLVHRTYAPIGMATAASAPSPAPHQQVATSQQVAPDQHVARQQQVAPDQQAAPEAAQGPAWPGDGAEEPAADQPPASEHVTFKSLRALETVDAHELLRHGAVPTGSMLQ